MKSRRLKTVKMLLLTVALLTFSVFGVVPASAAEAKATKATNISNVTTTSNSGAVLKLARIDWAPNPIYLNDEVNFVGVIKNVGTKTSTGDVYAIFRIDGTTLWDTSPVSPSLDPGDNEFDMYPNAMVNGSTSLSWKATTPGWHTIDVYIHGDEVPQNYYRTLERMFYVQPTTR